MNLYKTFRGDPERKVRIVHCCPSRIIPTTHLRDSLQAGSRVDEQLTTLSSVMSRSRKTARALLARVLSGPLS